VALSETLICNMSLARLGAKRLNDLTADTSVESIQARTHYEQTRDALLRGHLWKFALARAVLSEDTATPAFEWDHQFILPTDCLRVVGLYDTTYGCSLEGQRLLTDDSDASILYVRKITDPTAFDALFVEALVLSLALKLVMPLTQDKVLRRELQDELVAVMSRARLVNLNETNTAVSATTWNEARLGGVPV